MSVIPVSRSRNPLKCPRVGCQLFRCSHSRRRSLLPHMAGSRRLSLPPPSAPATFLMARPTPRAVCIWRSVAPAAWAACKWVSRLVAQLTARAAPIDTSSPISGFEEQQGSSTARLLPSCFSASLVMILVALLRTHKASSTAWRISTSVAPASRTALK